MGFAMARKALGKKAAGKAGEGKVDNPRKGLSADALFTLARKGFERIPDVKEGDHRFLFEQVRQAEREGRVTVWEYVEETTGVRHRFRFINDVPLNESNQDLLVNFGNTGRWYSSVLLVGNPLQHLANRPDVVRQAVLDCRRCFQCTVDTTVVVVQKEQRHSGLVVSQFLRV